MAQNEGAEIAWLVMAATTHLTFGFGKERLARLKQETLDNYRQYIGWVEQDGEAYAMELLRRCSEQALQEELKINDMRESKDHILPGGSAEAQRADMLRAMEAVSAIDAMLGLYETYCAQSDNEALKRGLRIIKAMYIDETAKPVEQIAMQENVSARQVYRDHDAAVDKISMLMFGIDALEMS